jgi:hypothetical protein
LIRDIEQCAEVVEMNNVHIFDCIVQMAAAAHARGSRVRLLKEKYPMESPQLWRDAKLPESVRERATRDVAFAAKYPDVMALANVDIRVLCGAIGFPIIRTTAKSTIKTKLPPTVRWFLKLSDRIAKLNRLCDNDKALNKMDADERHLVSVLLEQCQARLLEIRHAVEKQP